MTIQQMREKRAALAKELRNLVDTHPGKEGWGKDGEHQKVYERLAAEIGDLDAEVERTQRALDLDAASAHAAQRIADEDGVSLDEAHDTGAAEKRIFAAFLRGGVEGLTAQDRQYVARRRDEARRVMGTMSTTTPSEGGYLVPREFAATLIEAMKAFGGMRAVATVIGTGTGASLDYPTTDATSEEGEILGENASVTGADATFGIKTIGAFKYSSKKVAVPFELLQDAMVDLEGHIVQRLATRIARITNKHFTIGDGSGEPEGVVTAATAGATGASGQVDSVKYTDLLKLKHSVDPAYRDNGRFMFHDTTLLALKQLQDLQGRPLWLPGVALKEPDTIDGSPFVINQQMPTMAASAKSVLYGDFSKYIIRDVMAVLLFRMTDSAFTLQGQVGFVAFSRHDGKLVDVGGAVKAFAHPAS